jgi:integrase
VGHANRQRGLPGPLQKRNSLSVAEASRTVGQLAEWWLTTYVSRHAAVYKTSAMVRRHVISSSLGRAPLRDVTSASIEEFLQGKTSEVSAATVNKIRRALVTCFSRARKAGMWSEANPAQETDARPEAKKTSHHYLRSEEVRPVMEALASRWRPLFAISVYLGLRRGEALGLRKCDVDLNRRELVVQRSWRRDTTKGGHADVLPIPDGLVPWLKEAIEASPSELVFPRSNGQMMAEDVRLQHVLRRALARAGIVTGYQHVCRRHGCGFAQSTSDVELRRCPKDGRKLWPKAQVRPIRWHDLRHTTASLLKSAGVHLVDAQRILRHSDPRITQEVYTHVDLDQLRSAVNRMPLRIDNFPANVDGNVDGDAGRNERRKKRNNYGVFEEREKGFEPSTLALARRCSTAELFPHGLL